MNLIKRLRLNLAAMHGAVNTPHVNRECTESERKPLSECSDEGPTIETLDFAIRISSTPTFLYFDLYYLNTAYAAHYVYFLRECRFACL